MLLTTDAITLDKLLERGTLRVGYSLAYPYTYVDETQQVRGVAADTVRQLAKQFGIKQIEWLQMPPSSFMPQLHSRHIDIAATGLFINSERQQQVRFSRSTLQVYSGLLISANTPEAIRAIDLKAQHDALTLAVVEGSIEQQKLQKLTHKIVAFVTPDINTALDALDNQSIEGILMVQHSLKPIALSYPDDYLLLQLNKTQAPFSSADEIGLAFHPADEKLVNSWNQALKHWLVSEAYLNLIETYGFTPDNIPYPTAR